MSHAAVMVTGRRFVAMELRSATTLDGARTVVADLDPATVGTEDQAGVIRRALNGEGWSARQVTLVVPRHRVLVRRVSVPSGTAAEIDQMVRHQLERELDLPLEEVRFAYATEPPDPNGQLPVTVAALRIEDLQAYRSLLQKADLEVGSVVISTWCLPEAIDGQLDQDEGPAALALLEPDFGEVVVMEQGHPRAARSMEGIRDSGAASELMRTLPALEAQSGLDPVKTVMLFGRHHQACVSELNHAWENLRTTGLRCIEPEVGALDPVLVPVLGACLAQERHARPAGPDLLEERVRGSRWKPHRRKFIAGGIAAGFLLLWGISALWLAILQGKLEDLQAETRSDSKLVEELMGLERKMKVLDQWSNTRVSWAGVLDAVSNAELASAPRDDKRVVYLTDVTVAHFIERDAKRREHTRLRITLQGRAKTKQDAWSFYNELRKAPGVERLNLVDLKRQKKEDFPQFFTIRGVLLPGSWKSPEIARR